MAVGGEYSSEAGVAAIVGEGAILLRCVVASEKAVGKEELTSKLLARCLVVGDGVLKLGRNVVGGALMARGDALVAGKR